MIKINLLPKTQRQKSEVNVDLYVLIAVGVLTLGVICGVYIRNGRAIEYTASVTLKLQRTIAELQPVEKEFALLEKAKKDVSTKLTVIAKISEGRAIAPKLLYDLSSLVRDTMWLKSLRKDGTKLQIEGRSIDNESICDFVERLSKLPYVTDLELRSVEDAAEGGTTVKKFVVDGNVSA
jgi:type IV pilus assembly protein PilN